MKVFYFLYFLLTSDYKKVIQSLNYLKKKHSRLKLIIDTLLCSYNLGTSLDDYFCFRFYEKNKHERNEFASTLFMYKFHKLLNDKSYIDRIDNKSEFRKYFKEFSGPSEVFNIINKKGVDNFIKWIIVNNYHNLVIKNPLGTLGKNIYFAEYMVDSHSFWHGKQKYNPHEFTKNFSVNGELYVEPLLIQHPSLALLAPAALNTIRIITVLTPDNQVDIISAALRISIKERTDNFSTGNLAAAIDIKNGKIISPGIKRLAACSPIYEYHPISKQKILDFQIPMWEDVIAIVKKAAIIIPEVRTVGWDIAVLKDKVIIIEGNSKWNKGAPQIPLNKGIKPLLMKYSE